MTANVSRSLACGLVIALVLLLAESAVASEPREAEASLRRGLESFERGAFEQAASEWIRAAAAAKRQRKLTEQLTARLYLSDAYMALGDYRQAAEGLGVALDLATQSGDERRMASVLARLGRAYSAIGPVEVAEAYFRRGLEMARAQQDWALAASLLNDLGTVLSTAARRPDAVAAYRDSAALAGQADRPLLRARALTNVATALLRNGEPREAEGLLDTAFEHARNVKPSHDVAFTVTTVGLAYRDLRSSLPDASRRLVLKAFGTLREAIAIAENIGDRRMASYALGHLGALYEEEGRYQEALQLTRRAMFAAQQISAPESLYRWQWQSGRLLGKLGSTDAAIAAYHRAVATLQSVRPELATTYRDPQTSFREALGPLYFELVDLLLQRAASSQKPEEIQPHLRDAREVVELFKVAELRDYFKDDCVDLAVAKVTRLDVVSQTAIVVYPILLPDRTELLISLPTGLKRVAVPVRADMLTEEIRQFRRKLEKRTTREYLPHARQLYDWLIRPLEPDLESFRIDTLVFVPDGPLRTIPMAALHDGKQFLVARYALGTTPGLKVTEPRPIKRENMKVLAVGLTEAVQGFSALPNVAAELEALERMFRVTTLVDDAFRLPTLERTLKEEQFTIVHVASHGHFGGEPGNTFLLAFDAKLSMDQLAKFIGLFKFRDEPIELITLSACDTAEGDDRAALGLAGVAVKAGARSALATLWNVNDPASAQLIAEFYRHLQDPSVSRAAALQRAQLELLANPRYDHPGFWAPFLLINNWL